MPKRKFARTFARKFTKRYSRVPKKPYSRSVKRRTTGGTVTAKVNKLWKAIETKEGCYRVAKVDCPHNNVLVLTDAASGTPLNPFRRAAGTADPMDANPMQIVGDQCTMRGMKIKGFFECALGRSKVYFRLMLIRAPRSATIDRSSLFKGDSNNKMMDIVNTETFSIVWQKVFNVQTSNIAAYTITPNVNGVPSSGTAGGIGTKMISAWIPGRKFGRGGNVQYENGSTAVKFYDYRFVCLAYDWYGTPQDVNNVGVINEFYCKNYFKDA